MRPNGPNTLIVGVTTAGVAEGEPMTIVIVHAGRNVSKVSKVYSNGVSDGMNVVEGQAVLVTLNTIAPNGRFDILGFPPLTGHVVMRLAEAGTDGS